MASTEPQPLTFEDLDGLMLAAAKGRLTEPPATPRYRVGDIGPWLELRQLIQAGSLEFADLACWIAADPSLDTTIAGLSGDVLHDRKNGRLLLATTGAAAPDEEALSLLTLEIQKSSDQVGISKAILLRIRAALGEMIDNVFEHSERTDSGIALVQVKSGAIEFCVTDRGVGIRSSLIERYGDGLDHLAALRLALQPRVSRHPEEMGRGHGFDHLVLGMINLNAELRFRSGDACLSLSGVGATLPSSQLTRRPYLEGFLVAAKFYSDRPQQIPLE